MTLFQSLKTFLTLGVILALTACASSFQNPTFNAKMTSFYTKEGAFKINKDTPLDISHLSFEPECTPNALCLKAKACKKSQKILKFSPTSPCTLKEEAYDRLTYTCGQDTLILQDMGLEASGHCGVLFIYNPNKDIHFSYAFSAAKKCSPPVEFSDTGYWKIPY